MWNRVRAVFHAGFESQWGSGAWPAAPLVMHGSLAAVLCALVRDELPPYAYALFALSVSAALIALPLLGEFGALLRADPAAEWVQALPVSKLELRVARTLLLLMLIAALSSAALLPAALFAPHDVSLLGRAALFASGWGQALFIAAALLAVQSALGERAEALLVLLQTLLVGGIVVGLVAGLRWIPALAHVASPRDASPTLAMYPPAWFAMVLAAATRATNLLWSSAGWLASMLALATLAAAPLPPAARARTTGGWLTGALKPLRALATRVWLRAGERASFDLVFDALPLEREFVLRTYPMIGIPLAFLIAGARGETGTAHDGLLVLLLFTPATYLPILLAHVPVTGSPDARWILETAPVSRATIANGALKAVALRFIVPLYVVLFLLTWSQVSLSFAVRLALPAGLLSMIILRRLYPMCVHEPPLSVAPSEIQANMDWTGPLAVLAIGLTLVAVLALLYVTTIGIGLAISAMLLGIEWWLDRSASASSMEVRT